MTENTALNSNPIQESWSDGTVHKASLVLTKHNIDDVMFRQRTRGPLWVHARVDYGF